MAETVPAEAAFRRWQWRHDRRTRWLHLALFVAALAALAAPLYLLAGGRSGSSTELHAGLMLVSGLCALAAGGAMALRHYVFGGQQTFLHIGVAFLAIGIADATNAGLYLRFVLPFEENVPFLGETLLRGELLIGAALLAALAAPLGGWALAAAAAGAGLAVAAAMLGPLPDPNAAPWAGLWRPASLAGALLAGAGVACLVRYMVRHEALAWWLLLAVGANLLGIRAFSLAESWRDVHFDLALFYKLLGNLMPLAGYILYLLAAERSLVRTVVALEGAREAALAGARAKTTFLANTSHEIRTPLAGMLGLLARNRRKELPAPLAADLAAAESSGRALLTLLDDVLDLAKAEAGRLELRPAPFAIADAVEAACRAVRSTAEEKGLGFRVRLADDLPALVVGDAGRLRQTLINLLGNAVKFTDRGAVALEVAWEDRRELRLRCSVSDNGPGIAPADLPLVFEPFRQASSHAGKPGAGLGLAIAADLVRLMGGRLWAESAVGAGSTFHFTARFASAGDAEAPLPSAPVLPPLLLAERRLTVAIAEDDPVNRRVLVGWLQDLGHRVLPAEDGAGLLALLKAHPEIDAGITDLRMPGMDGYAAAAEWRAADRAAQRRRPLFALTAQALAADAERGAAAGFDAVLAKPVDPDRLQALLEQHTAAAGPAPAVDEAALLKQVGGRTALLAELVGLFAADMPPLLDRLDAAAAHGSAEDVRELAHRLAGSAANFHAAPTRELARRVERDAAAGRIDAGGIAELRRVASRLLDTLRTMAGAA